MKTTSIIILAALAITASISAQSNPTKQESTVVRIDKHPENIMAHYGWCLNGKDLKTRTIRLRDFWEDHRPEDGDYGDSIHGRYVLLAAYKLTENYCRLKDETSAIAMLDWIRSEDSRLIEEERK